MGNSCRGSSTPTYYSTAAAAACQRYHDQYSFSSASSSATSLLSTTTTSSSLLAFGHQHHHHHPSASPQEEEEEQDHLQQLQEEEEEEHHQQQQQRTRINKRRRRRRDKQQIMPRGHQQLLSSPTAVLGHATPPLRELYTLGRKLGQGQFGTTYLCTEVSTGAALACKSIAKRKLLTPEDVDDVRREIQIMHHLAGHASVVTIKGAYEDPLYVHIVMELCEGGELFDRIVDRGYFSERKAAEIARVIVGVVEACHSLGVMHRDLKPENFLLLRRHPHRLSSSDDDDDNDDNMSLKAIDFGLSVFFKPGQVFTDVVGSPYYVAPEVLCRHYGPEADVWTAGVIIYILLSGVPPFWAETQQGIFDAVLKGAIDFDSDPWPAISDSAKDLIRRMLTSPPADRLTAHQVLCHPWICENGVAPDRALDPAVLSRLKHFSAMNRLKKMALRVIAQSLSDEELAGLKEMFKAMDTDGSGAITFDELKEGLRRHGSNLRESEIRDLMDAADVDNSGTIDYDEFIAATVHMSKLEREEHLLAAFAYFDKDGSGYITVDELEQACRDHNMADAGIDDIIREVDQDNDGRIDYAEFVAMMKKGIIGHRPARRE